MRTFLAWAVWLILMYCCGRAIYSAVNMQRYKHFLDLMRLDANKAFAYGKRLFSTEAFDYDEESDSVREVVYDEHGDFYDDGRSVESLLAAISRMVFFRLQKFRFRNTIRHLVDSNGSTEIRLFQGVIKSVNHSKSGRISLVLKTGENGTVSRKDLTTESFQNFYMRKLSDLEQAIVVLAILNSENEKAVKFFKKQVEQFDFHSVLTYLKSNNMRFFFDGGHNDLYINSRDSLSVPKLSFKDIAFVLNLLAGSQSGAEGVTVKGKSLVRATKHQFAGQLSEFQDAMLENLLKTHQLNPAEKTEQDEMQYSNETQLGLEKLGHFVSMLRTIDIVSVVVVFLSFVESLHYRFGVSLSICVFGIIAYAGLTLIEDMIVGRRVWRWIDGGSRPLQFLLRHVAGEDNVVISSAINFTQQRADDEERAVQVLEHGSLISSNERFQTYLSLLGTKLEELMEYKKSLFNRNFVAENYSDDNLELTLKIINVGDKKQQVINRLLLTLYYDQILNLIVSQNQELSSKIQLGERMIQIIDIEMDKRFAKLDLLNLFKALSSYDFKLMLASNVDNGDVISTTIKQLGQLNDGLKDVIAKLLTLSATSYYEQDIEEMKRQMSDEDLQMLVSKDFVDDFNGLQKNRKLVLGNDGTEAESKD